MRRDRLYLADIVEACQSIGTFATGRTRADFDTDALLLSAILHQLTIIGEAASRISTEIRDRHPQIPWRQVAGMRNYVVHAYFSLDRDIVWETVTAEVPKLRWDILQVSDAEFGQDDVIQ